MTIRGRRFPPWLAAPIFLAAALCPVWVPWIMGAAPADPTAELQARLDAAPPYSAVVLTGDTTLSRPLIMDRDKIYLVGAPSATLRTAGAFPAIVAGAPPSRRRPGWPGKHRVKFPGSETITAGLDLSDAAARFRSSAFEWILAGKQRATISGILARKGDTWGTAGTQAVLVATDGDRAEADNLRITVAHDRLYLWFRTADDVTRQFFWRRPGNPATARVVILMDLAAAKVGAYIDGVYASPIGGTPGPGWTPDAGLVFARPKFPDFATGRDGNAGQANAILGGLRFSDRLEYPWPAEGAKFAASDLAAFGPSASQSSASLDLAAPPVGPDDPFVWYVYKGNLRGCGMLTPTSRIPGASTGAWDDYDTVGEIQIRNLAIIARDRDYGSCLDIGVTRNLQLDNLDLVSGAVGIDSYEVVVSYPLWIRQCRFAGNSKFALALGKGIVYCDALTFDRGPADGFIKVHSAGGLISRFFMAEQGQPQAVSVKNFIGNLSFLDGTINNEGGAAIDAYFRLRRDQVGKGRVGTVVIRNVEVGSAAPRDSVVKLEDPYWKGRTDGEIGSAAAVAENSFMNVVRTRPIFGEASAGWKARQVSPGADVPIPIPFVVPAFPRP